MRVDSLSASVGRRLRQLRLDRGVSLPRLARWIGLSASALEAIEEGRTPPSVGTLADLAAKLGASAAAIVREATGAVIAPTASHTAIGSADIGRAVVELPDGVNKLELVEAAAIRYAIQITRGNKSEAARRLGVGRRTIERKIARHRLWKERG
jgi:transcriptional regulator with XRE-family HTH domain